MPDIRDLLPPPPWEGPPLPRGLSSRIRGMTEHEIAYALAAEYLGKPGGITPDELITHEGDWPRTRSLIRGFEEWKKRYENPNIYWDEVIANLEERLREVREKKLKKIKPPMPYHF